MKWILLIYIGLMSLIAFAAFGLDKFKAKTDRWRIPERTLFLLAILGGGIGAFLGMQMFRHKTKHTQFVVGIPVIINRRVVTFRACQGQVVVCGGFRQVDRHAGLVCQFIRQNPLGHIGIQHLDG